MGGTTISVTVLDENDEAVATAETTARAALDWDRQRWTATVGLSGADVGRYTVRATDGAVETPAEDRFRVGPTPMPTATPTAVATSTPTPEPTTTSGPLVVPGFGWVATVTALLVLLVVVRARRSPEE